ncbi:YceH family protein [Aquimonas voraii]|uniref:Uncharacterized protein n=1 Tax=Aquimonas voraii TaxID=265719 RepID=A0A1G6SGD4_9GAMM|nr:YceH family protein [Aquimonas voraii]SDD15980.1 hypothetical protein SAMN04488509_101495 [Aquimonas voraii]
MNEAAESHIHRDSADGAAPPRLLTEIEARILASLFEKAQTTPEQYPLTVNALQLACNQKNNRDPVSQYEQGAIVHALRDLENRGWARQSSEGVRAQRWEHRLDQHLGLTPRKAAVLCTLLLRGPQTLNEIHTRSERLTPFPGVEDVEDTLERLIERAPPLVVKLPRQPGQREERYMHLLFGAVDPSLLAERAGSERVPRGSSGLEARVEALEAEVAELRTALQALGAL